MRRAIAVSIVAVSFGVLIAARGHSAHSNDGEVIRIQNHLAAVGRTLGSASTAHLTQEQRAARRLVLEWLDEYRAAGVFPHNHVRPGERVPVFVDPHGSPCAVGYLMLRSGEEALVEEIVRTDNLVRVHELRDDPRVANWLRAHGLTLDEAALIQPAYDGPPPQREPLPVPSMYRPATVGLSLASVALASYMATTSPRRGEPWMDLLAVGTALGHTYLLLDADVTTSEEPRWAIGLNWVGLATSLGSEVLRLARRGGDEEAGPYVAPGVNGTEIGFALRH